MRTWEIDVIRTFLGSDAQRQRRLVFEGWRGGRTSVEVMFDGQRCTYEAVLGSEERVSGNGRQGDYMIPVPWSEGGQEKGVPIVPLT